MALFFIDRYSEGMLGKILIVIAVISIAALGGILNNTTPSSAGAFGVLCVFLFAYLITMSVMSFLISGISRLIRFFAHLVAAHRPVQVISLQHAYYYATILALAPVMLISMTSVGKIGFYEVCLIAILEILGCLYVTKRLAR